MDDDEDLGFVPDDPADPVGFEAAEPLHTTGRQRLELPETTFEVDAADPPRSRTIESDAPAVIEREVTPAQDTIPAGYAETGAQRLVLPETTFVSDARRPRRSETLSSTAAPEVVREVAKAPGGRGPTVPAGTQVGPDVRTTRQRLHAYLSGRDPEALAPRVDTDGDGVAERIAPAQVGGFELPSLASARRAVASDGEWQDRVGALFPTAPTRDGRPIVGWDLRDRALATGITDGVPFVGDWIDEAAGLIGGDSRRDYEREVSRRTQEQAPEAHGVGRAVGASPLMLVPGGQATALGRIGVTAGVGGLAGFASGAGASDEEDVAGRLSDGARQGAIEGVTAGALGAAGEVAMPAARGVAGWLGRHGEQMAEPAARLRNSAAGARYAPETDQIDDPVRFAEVLRESGISGGLRSTRSAGERATEVRRAANAEITRLADEAASAERAAREAMPPTSPDPTYRDTAAPPIPGTITIDRLAEELQRVTSGIDGQGAPATGARAQIQALLERYREAYPDGVIPLSELMGDWRAFGNPANFRDGQPWNTLAESRRGLRRGFRGMMEEAMESASGPEARATLGQSLERVHAGRTVERGARRVADRQSGNRLLSLTDYLAAGSGATAGALTGDPITGVLTASLAALGNRAVRGREHAAGAVVLENLAPALRNLGAQGQRWAQTLEAAQGRGPQALAAAHFLLSRRDPDYRQAAERLAEQEQEQ